MAFRRFFLNLSLVVLLVWALGAAMARPARAMDSDVKAVITGGLYGMGAGTVLGLASFPFTGNPRHIFIGTSVGLYLGVAVGLYYVWYKYDPENPLGPNYRNYEDPEPDYESGYRAGVRPLNPGQPGGWDRPLFESRFELARF